MKRTIKHQLFWALALTGALLFTSCQEEGDVDDEMYIPVDENFNMTSAGGVLSFYDGDVILSFPEGAILNPQKFTVNVCSGDGECPYLLSPIKIEPFTIFSKPVELSIRYNGCLCTGNNIIDGESCIKVLNWDNQQDFIDQILGEPCTFGTFMNDEASATIILSITQTGVFAFTEDTPL